ncbi:unnamed protein product [Staurois parvus]|uniref:Uncharacterized protein n=1 Tax=Staurois parvus TaxID=386267 RepID=A0ABN9AF81_9NEOB|nr:unnamed protein product [Staurois parvus]
MSTHRKGASNARCVERHLSAPLPCLPICSSTPTHGPTPVSSVESVSIKSLT